MPTQQVMQGSHDIAGFLNVIGAVDGTHIRIKSPSNDEHLYVNKKNYYSINVQGVCDSKLRFINIVQVPRLHILLIYSRKQCIKNVFESGAVAEVGFLGIVGIR